ncbi:porin [Vibrio sp. SCSIO 43136]|uniref:porin n=1 Tax=Vibrio sp. SCSIO 43136 TaxID=2819101 RepID=UPI002076479B|nr:porin [Vibrio sp. SCSIO 43136]USD67804.1 porin [Vibrio sp. SCSIO 43136]
MNPKKSFITLSTLAVSILAATSANALEVYNADGTSFEVYGAIAAHVTHNNFDGADSHAGYSNGTYIEDPGSFAGISASHYLEPFTLSAKVEADIEFNTNSDSLLSNSETLLAARQVYVGVGHDSVGTFKVGMVESPYMKTDKGYFSIWAGGAAMMLSDELGSRRVSNTIVWEKEWDNLSIGVQYQAKRTQDLITFGNGYNAGTLVASFETLGIDGDSNGTAYGENFSIEGGYGFGAEYAFDNGATIAVGYNHAKGISGNGIDALSFSTVSLDDAKHTGVAVAGVYPVTEALALAGRFEQIENDYTNNTANDKFQNITLGVNYQWEAYLRSYVGVDRIYNKTSGATEDTPYTGAHIGTAFAPVAWGEIYLELYNTDYEVGSVEVTGQAVYFGAAALF